MTFSPDGRTLATASADDEERAPLWDLAPLAALRQGAVREACARAGEALDPATWELYAPGVDYSDTCATVELWR